MAHIIPDIETASAEDFAKFTHDTWRDLDITYQYWIPRWKRVIEFLRGQHWNTIKKIDSDKLPAWKRFPLINYTLAFYMDYMSDFLKSKVRWSATAASPDPADISAAELIEQLNIYVWEKVGMEAKRVELAAWLLATGTAHLRTFWDTNTGKMIPLAFPGPDGQLIPLNEQGQPNPGGPMIQVDQGEIGIEVVSPQYVRHSPVNAHGVMVGLLLSKEEVTSLYGEDVADDLNYTSSYEDFDTNLHTIETPTVIPTRDERALVIEHYIPRSSLHPDGLWWVADAGGKKMLHQPSPLPGGHIPIVTFTWIPIPGQKYVGMTPLYDITFSNKMYEELMARVLEWHNKVKPKILLKNGGGLTYGDINDEPFQELVVNPGGEPQVMEFRQAPDTFYRSMQDAQQDMMMVGGYQFNQPKGTQDTGQGQSLNSFRKPSNPVELGPAALAIMNSSASWEKIGRLIPAYAAAFYTEPRVIAIQGTDRTYQWKEFIGAVDLKDINATIKIDETSLYPWNRQALKDSVASVLDSSFGQMLFAGPDGQPNMDRINAAMNATGIDTAIEGLDPDIIEARNEHSAFKEGQQVGPPEFWQQHEVHLDEHEKVLKSMTFKSWPPQAQDAFKQHVQATSEELNKAAEEEQQSMIAMEKALRDVRETAEMQANIKEFIAKAVVESVTEAIKAGIPVEGDDSSKDS